MKYWSAMGLLCCAVFGFAHPAHVSMAEMTWNGERSTLEVTWSLAAEDLSLALRRLHGQRIELATSEGFGVHVDALLARHFRLVDSDGQPLTARYVGIEYAQRLAWIYFEIPVPNPQLPLRMRNTLLLAVRQGQVNTVILNHGNYRQSYSFQQGSDAVRIGPFTEGGRR